MPDTDLCLKVLSVQYHLPRLAGSTATGDQVLSMCVRCIHWSLLALDTSRGQGLWGRLPMSLVWRRQSGRVLPLQRREVLVSVSVTHWHRSSKVQIIKNQLCSELPMREESERVAIQQTRCPNEACITGGNCTIQHIIYTSYHNQYTLGCGIMERSKAHFLI